MQGLRGRTAFVTGGGSGIGRGIALALADEGMNLAIGDIDGASAAAVADELRARGSEALGIAVDVTDEGSLAKAADETRRELGGPALLVCNAGVSPPQGPLAEKTQRDWDWGFSVNLFGVVKSVQALLPGVRAAAAEAPGEAHIVLNASMAALVTYPQLQGGVYGPTKYACLAYGEQLRAELAPEGIGVSVLCPGLVDTPLAATSARSRPERFGGPFEAGPGVLPEELRSHAMPPEEVGPIVVRGVRANRLHLFTHPVAVRPMIERRFRQILEDCDAAAG